MKRGPASLLLVLAAPAALVASIAACSDIPCFYGVYPYDGATGVPLDTVLRFVAGESLSNVLPALAPGISLVRLDTGAHVPFTVDLDAKAGIVSVIPDEPLAADVDYALSGIDDEAVRNPQHASALDLAAVNVRFSTASDPTVLHAWEIEDGTVVLVLSEPVPPFELDLEFPVDQGTSPIVRGLYEGESHLVHLAGFSYGSILVEGVSVEVTDEPDQGLDWYRSLSVCTDVGFFQ